MTIRQAIKRYLREFVVDSRTFIGKSHWLDLITGADNNNTALMM